MDLIEGALIASKSDSSIFSDNFDFETTSEVK